MSLIEKTYLGDGVYVEIERGMIKLTSENGYEVLNTIYLEPEVFNALTVYEQRVRMMFERKAE